MRYLLLLGTLVVGCKPAEGVPTTSTSPIFRGSLEAPVPLEPHDSVVGFFVQQRLGERILAARAGDGTERFVFSSSPVVPDPGFSDFPYTPGELVFYEDQGISALIRGTRPGFGSAIGPPLDVDQDGIDEVLVYGGGNAYLFDTSERGTVEPDSVMLWSADFSDYPGTHPLHTHQIRGPGPWFGLSNDLVVGTSFDATLQFRFDEVPGPATPSDVVDGFLRNAWRWEEGESTVVTVVDGTDWYLEALGGALDGQQWTNFTSTQDSIQRGFTIDGQGAFLLMQDVDARSIVAKPLDEDDSPPFTLLGTVHTPNGDLIFSGGPMAIGHFDADDVDDLAMGSGPHEVAVWLGPLEGTLTDRPPDLVFSVPNDDESPRNSYMEAADLNGDGVDELAVSATNYGPGTVYIYRDLFAPPED